MLMNAEYVILMDIADFLCLQQTVKAVVMRQMRYKCFEFTAQLLLHVSET